MTSNLEQIESGYSRFEIDAVNYRIKSQFLPQALKAMNVQELVENATKTVASSSRTNDKQEASIE